jgi:hypothetical protein
VVAARLTSDRPDWANVRALLIRPDGHIAWATNDPTEANEQTQAALSRWLETREEKQPRALSLLTSREDRATTSP